MHTSIRRYEVETSQMDELMRRIDEGFARHIAVRPGFATYEAVDCAGDLVTVSAFMEAEEAEASRSLARDWVANELTDLSVEVIDVLHGEVVVNRADKAALHPAHSETSDEHADIRRVAVAGGDAAGALHAIDSELADSLTELPGFLSFRAADCGDEIVLISLFESAEQAEASTQLTTGYLADPQAGSGLEERQRFAGNLRVSRTRKRMLNEAHG